MKKRDSDVVFNIHVLRGIAAMMVVFFHTGIDLDKGKYWLGGIGAKGVELFFVISGFIMVFTTVSRPMLALTFIKNRLLRIVPLYWLITLFVFALAAIAPNFFKATRPDLGELFLSLTFIPFVKSNGLVHPMLPVGWTLNYEMFFYILFTLGLLVPRYWVGVIGVAVLLAIMVMLGKIFEPTSTISWFYTRPIVSLFGYGMILGLVWRIPRITSCLKYFAMLMLIVSSTLFWCGPTGIFLPSGPIYGILAAGIVASALLLERCGAKLTWPILQLLGNASYSIYLTHSFVTGAIGKAVESWLLHHRVLLPIMAIFTMLACMLVGIAVHLWLEEPLSKLLRIHVKKSA